MNNWCVNRRQVLIGLLLMVVMGLKVSSPVAKARVWHVCMQCQKGDVKTIDEALRRAEPKDTILVYWEPGFPYYMEHLVIEKPVRIISVPAAGDITDFDLFPVLTSGTREIIHIKVPGVELIGFNIMYLARPGKLEEERRFEGRVGIRLSAPALIQSCAITNCTTGILAAYETEPAATGSHIEKCRLGLPADHGLNLRGLNQTNNHFGLVLLGNRRPGKDLGKGIDVIDNCQIMRNESTGVVYTPANPPVMNENLVELNGGGPFKIVHETLDTKGYLRWMTML